MKKGRDLTPALFFLRNTASNTVRNTASKPDNHASGVPERER